MAEEIQYCDVGHSRNHLPWSPAVRLAQATVDGRMQTLVCVGQFPSGVNFVTAAWNPITFCTLFHGFELIR